MRRAAARAEEMLADRRKRRDELDVRPLPGPTRDPYVHEWRAVQERFVDDPASAIGDADELVQQVMRERGYPVEAFEQRAADLSVDHPEVVVQYRAAHGTARAHASSDATTEDLRGGPSSLPGVVRAVAREGGGDDALSGTCEAGPVQAARPSLAAAVVERIRPVAPPEIAVYEEPRGWVTAQIDEERWIAVPIEAPDDDALDEDVEYDPPYPAFGVLTALDAVQELARDELGVEWPPGAPAPAAELADDQIRLWFGDEADPVLAFEPIRV